MYGSGELPGGLVVRIWHFHFCGLDSMPGPGTEIPFQAAACVTRKKKKVSASVSEYFKIS